MFWYAQAMCVGDFAYRCVVTCLLVLYCAVYSAVGCSRLQDFVVESTVIECGRFGGLDNCRVGVLAMMLEIVDRVNLVWGSGVNFFRLFFL